jgi:hypothetical protein
MKYSTKQVWVRRIYHWVCRIFNYQERIQPWIIEERKIQRIRSEHIIHPNEALVFSKAEIERNVAKNIINVMLITGAIKFEWEEVEGGMEKITATTYVPEKL